MYLRLTDKGLEAGDIHEILEQIEGSSYVENPGALFVAKAKSLLGIEEL